MRRDNLELLVGAVFRGFVGAPTSEVREMTETRALHVFIRDFNDELGTKRLPREVLALAPSALAAGHALVHRVGAGFGPGTPRMVGERVVTIGFEELDELAALLLREAGADADVLQCSGGVVEAEEKRADGLVLGVLVPAEAGDDAV